MYVTDTVCEIDLVWKVAKNPYNPYNISKYVLYLHLIPQGMVEAKSTSSNGNKGQKILSVLWGLTELHFSQKSSIYLLFSPYYQDLEFELRSIWYQKQNNFKWLYRDPLTLIRVKVSGSLTSWDFSEKTRRYSAAAPHPGEFIWYCEK